jgi:hypothetical protein
VLARHGVGKVFAEDLPRRRRRSGLEAVDDEQRAAISLVEVGLVIAEVKWNDFGERP